MVQSGTSLDGLSSLECELSLWLSGKPDGKTETGTDQVESVSTQSGFERDECTIR